MAGVKFAANALRRFGHVSFNQNFAHASPGGRRESSRGTSAASSVLFNITGVDGLISHIAALRHVENYHCCF